MSKADVSALLVVAVLVLAALFVAELRRRPSRERKVSLFSGSRQDADEAVSAALAEDPPSTSLAVSPTGRALTARERRHEEIRILASGERCLYCQAAAEWTLPYARSTPPGADFAALITGDLPRHWRVQPPVEGDPSPMLCSSHAQIARSAVELRIARAHGDYVAFVSAQKEELHEFARHGLDEALRAEADRVRKGARNGGSA